MRARIGVFAVMLVAILVFASPVLACEKCTLMYDSLVKMCSSGNASGSQWCYGGFGSPCSTGGSCGGGGGLGDDGPFSPDYAMAGQPCLSCTGDEPAQGFVLRSEGALAGTLIKGSAPRIKPPVSGRR